MVYGRDLAYFQRAAAGLKTCTRLQASGSTTYCIGDGKTQTAARVEMEARMVEFDCPFQWS